jgi:opacity protein-like surface antigen
VADNVALGLEGKYLFSSGQTVRLDGEAWETDLNTALLSFSFRLLYPQLDPQQAATSGASGSTSFYFGVRAGGGVPVHGDVFPGVEARAEPASIGDTLNQHYGFALGANFGRHLGVELPFEGYEMRLRVPGGTIGEYAVGSLIPQLRVRYPMWNDRLEPYLVGGVGASFGELNDTGSGGLLFDDVDSEELGLGATIGAGVEYFVATNIAFGVEARYLFARGQKLRLGEGPWLSGNLDSVLVTVGLRIFLFEFGRGV